MGNKLKALVIGTAILVTPVLATTTAEASTTSGAAVVQLQSMKRCWSYWDFMYYIAFGVQGYRWNCG